LSASTNNRKASNSTTNKVFTTHWRPVPQLTSGGLATQQQTRQKLYKKKKKKMRRAAIHPIFC
jgi:hypothetical protein